MIRLEDTCIIFHPGTVDETVALQPCNLQIDRGDFITVIGTNGAGKSTLFNAISGHFSLSSGQIFLNETIYRTAANGKEPNLSAGFSRTRLWALRQT